MSKIKTAAPPYMNARPLVWGLGREPKIEGGYIVPSQIAGMLERREIAAGLVSVAALFSNPELQIVPGMSISCDGPAESVKLFNYFPFETMRTLALDTSSLSSVLLAKVILEEKYGLKPEYVPMHPSVPDMLASCDAAVVIGDTTMCTVRGKYGERDLGQEWKDLTDLPFVFAVWAVNPEMASPELVEILARSKALGISSLRDVANAESGRLGLPEEVCYHYLAEVMDYDLTDRHLEALNLFREKARQYGYATSDHKIELYR